jgi:hypothetical protein
MQHKTCRTYEHEGSLLCIRVDTAGHCTSCCAALCEQEPTTWRRQLAYNMRRTPARVAHQGKVRLPCSRNHAALTCSPGELRLRCSRALAVAAQWRMVRLAGLAGATRCDAPGPTVRARVDSRVRALRPYLAVPALLRYCATELPSGTSTHSGRRRRHRPVSCSAETNAGSASSTCRSREWHCGRRMRAVEVPQRWCPGG